jgi:hypothetical protein
MFPKYVAALLTLWYSLSIIGFDVHSCATTGDTFVNSVLCGLTCEDIHPEHDCSSHGSCCGSHECHDHEPHDSSCCNDQNTPSVDRDEECCTNDIEVLDSEGLSVQDDEGSVSYASADFQYINGGHGCHLYAEKTYLSYRLDPGRPPFPDSQAMLNIWRI